MPRTAPAPVVTADEAARGLEDARRRTLALVAPLSDADCERSFTRILSPLAWDLAHIAAYEDLWLVHRLGGERLLHPELAALYDAFETPRAVRAELPLLSRPAAEEYLAEVRDRTLRTIEREGTADGVLAEMVIRHELQHTETMLQALQLANLSYEPEGRPARGASPGNGHRPPTGLEVVEVPGGPCMLGAPAEGFSYDNERPRHRTDVRAFLMGANPISNGTWLTFSEGGGYERREWWSDEGWAWKEEYDIGRPAGWTADGREWRLGRLEPLDPHRPVVHVSWFEADAFARAHGARLPTEAEWEKAATWDQDTGTARRFPWGAEAPTPRHAALDWRLGGPGPAGGCPDGASPCGALGMLGDVWEWTATEFDGYPGFAAHPYREYSEVFFTQGYRVLRGGSWATDARVACPTFRNWDHPQRRQIFSGVRIAKDLP